MSATPPTVIITQPCTVKWSAMTGDARVRHCGQCNRFVHRLSKLTSAQVTELLEQSKAKGERVCVSLCRRSDGTVITKDAPSWWQQAREMAAARVGHGSTTSGVGVLGLVLLFLVTAFIFMTLFGDNVRLLFSSSVEGGAGETSVPGNVITQDAP